MDLATLELIHQICIQRDDANADLADLRERHRKLTLDYRTLQDRLAELSAPTVRSGRLVRLVGGGARLHHGPPGRCNCGMAHSSGQAVALNAGLRDRTEAAS